MKILRFAGLAATAALLSAAGASASLAECKTLGAIGTGITVDIAKFMAEAGLKNIRESKGMTAQGAVTFKCDPGVIVTECSARQRACK
jgi:hypothetical protein